VLAAIDEDERPADRLNMTLGPLPPRRRCPNGSGGTAADGTACRSFEPWVGTPRRFGYSRDQRPDCVQAMIALIVTPEGFPVAYEVMPGNTLDKTTLPAFLRRIEKQYGKVNRL